MGTARFRDDGRVLEHFVDPVLVICPRCSRAAEVNPIAGGTPAVASRPPPFPAWSAPRQLTCRRCGLTDRRKHSSVLLGAPVDPYFRIPVFLSAPFREWTVWAYNFDHLDVLSRYVQAAVRERPLHSGSRHAGSAALPDRAARPMSMIEKLPDWMSAAGHRDAVGHVLEQLSIKARSAAQT